MRIFSWLFGKREASAAAVGTEQKVRMEEKPAPAAAPIVEKPTTVAAPPEPPQRTDSPADNLRRWRESGQPRAWIEARHGRWDHDAWLALLEDLKKSSFWPMDPDAIGLTLEEIRHEWLSRN